MAAERLRAALRRLRARFSDESGFTLAELLVASVIGIATVATGMTLITMAAQTQPQLSERAAQIEKGRVMMERIAQELRQGESIFNATSSGFQVLTLVSSETCGGVPAPSGMPCRVTYSCTASVCTRTERNPDGGGTAPAEQLVDGIMGPAVFSFSPSAANPDYVTISLSFPADDGTEAVTLRDGVALRNYLESDTET